MGTKPKSLALVVCDSILAPLSGTGKLTLSGLFDRIGGSSFPLKQAEFFVFAELVGVKQGDKLSISILQSSDNSDVATATSDIQPHNDSDRATAIMSMAGIVFPQPGEYEVVLRVNNAELSRRSIELAQVELSKDSKKPKSKATKAEPKQNNPTQKSKKK